MPITNNKLQKNFKTGQVIIQQGDVGDCAYIIEKGRVEVSITVEGKRKIIGTRGPGAIIGEMSLLDNAPRMATITAVDDCVLLEITREGFDMRLNAADPVIRMVAQIILTRYRDTLNKSEIIDETDGVGGAEKTELDYAAQSHAVEDIKLASEFHEAIFANDLSLHYQPMLNLQTGKVVGFEALMRWIHSERGFVSPDVFIPLAERNGSIVEASKWALREACSALKRMEEATGTVGQKFMSVNFSSKDFASDGFVDTLYETISKSDVQPSQVHLEITERLLMSQPENARETLQQCSKAGMSISIDDFGTGYSSLSYLHYFPIDILKIDRSFVMNMTKDEESMALIKSIIGLGKNMKMEIVAEGVETKEEENTLRELGCNLAQGYYFAKPMPEDEVIHYMRSLRSL